MARKGVGINFSKNALNALSIKVNLDMQKKKNEFHNFFIFDNLKFFFK